MMAAIAGTTVAVVEVLRKKGIKPVYNVNKYKSWLR